MGSSDGGKELERPDNDMIDCDVMTFWDGKFAAPIAKDYKISLCITCMNRLHDLRITLPANLHAEKDYPELEFVLLDYNSSDGLGEWVKRNMAHHLESGRLAYYRTDEPRFYSMTHSRNVAFKLATGDIVNNLDADNFTYTNDARFRSDECWTSYMNRMANQCHGDVIFARGKRVNHGRVGFYKSDFVNLLGGYNEQMTGYGHDDYDIIKRALHLGFSMYWWGTAYIDRVRTDVKDRMTNLDMTPYTSLEDMVDAMKDISDRSIEQRQFKANEGRYWGRANLTKNFNTGVTV